MLWSRLSLILLLTAIFVCILVDLGLKEVNGAYDLNYVKPTRDISLTSEIQLINEHNIPLSIIEGSKLFESDGTWNRHNSSTSAIVESNSINGPPFVAENPVLRIRIPIVCSSANRLFKKVIGPTYYHHLYPVIYCTLLKYLFIHFQFSPLENFFDRPLHRVSVDNSTECELRVFDSTILWPFHR